MTPDIEVFKKLNIELVHGVFTIDTGRASADTVNKFFQQIIKSLSLELNISSMGMYYSGLIRNYRYVDLVIDLSTKNCLFHYSNNYVEFRKQNYGDVGIENKNLLKENNICVIKTGPDMFHKIGYSDCEYSFHVIDDKILLFSFHVNKIKNPISELITKKHQG